MTDTSPYPSPGSDPAAAQTRSRWSVVLSTLASLLLVSMCVVCGAGLYFFRPTVSDDPEGVVPMTSAMLRVDVPSAFEPRGTIEWDFFWLVLMRGAYYELTADEGVLLFIQVESRLMDEPDIRRHVDRTLQEKGGGGPPLTITESEERVFEIRGREVPFRFQVGESPANRSKYHLVEGIVDGNSGPVLVAFRIRDDSWAENEPLVLQTIQSIR